MENKKAGEGDIPSPDLDQEFELRTSAPQEEMERYYLKKKASLLRKLRKINKKIKKIYIIHMQATTKNDQK